MYSHDLISHNSLYMKKFQVTTFVTVFIDDTLSVYSGSGPTFENELYRFDVEENQSEQQIGRLEVYTMRVLAIFRLFQAHHRAVEFGKDKIFYTFDKTSTKEQQTNLESVFRIGTNYFLEIVAKKTPNVVLCRSKYGSAK